ncbi:MAG: hypothetical protein NZ789_16410, partial [Pseudomonadales bacterium]|nr:hypothetical protein [Pseudomonadales bacterium]
MGSGTAVGGVSASLACPTLARTVDSMSGSCWGGGALQPRANRINATPAIGKNEFKGFIIEWT